MTLAWDKTKQNVAFFGQQFIGLPAAKITLGYYSLNKPTTQFEIDHQKRLANKVQQLQSCGSFVSQMDDILNFYKEATKLIFAVQRNIVVIEKYKTYPFELSQWMRSMDKYLGDIVNFLNSTIFAFVKWMNINAKIYSKYVDALILIVSTIKSYQIMLDLSTNWSKRCGKCTQDTYGSYSCSLASLLLKGIKLPILPLPPLKIPNIYLDLSHIDL